MDLLDDLYFYHAKHHHPADREYRELCELEERLSQKLREVHPDLTEKLVNVVQEREEIERKAFFLYGLRFALALQRL